MSFFVDINYKTLNLTIANFEHPGLEIIEKYFAPVQFCLTTIAFIVMIYVALTQSPKKMKSYSFLLIYQICTTYTFDVLTLVIQPVLLLPYSGAYVNGFWQYGENGNCIIYLLFTLNIVVIIHSLFIQFIFRLSSLYDTTNWIFKFTKLKFLLLFMLPMLLFLLTFACGKLFS